MINSDMINSDNVVALFHDDNLKFSKSPHTKILPTEFERVKDIVERLRIYSAMHKAAFLAQDCLPIPELLEGKIDSCTVDRYLKFYLYLKYRLLYYFDFTHPSDKCAFGAIQSLFLLINTVNNSKLNLKNVEFSLDITRNTPQEFSKIHDVILMGLDEAKSTFYERMLESVYLAMFDDMTPQFNLNILSDLIYTYSRIELNSERDSKAFIICDTIQDAILFSLLRAEVKFN